MPACCICYTTDPGYLFPTFVSAVQARYNASPEKADVAIFCFGADSAARRVFGRACEAEGIRLITPLRDTIEGAAVMMSRLFLTRFVPGEYEQFLYLDGDTQIRASLDPLIDAEVPPGHFMAANDPMTFSLTGPNLLGRGPVLRHLSALGISPNGPYSYFNTGVLRINRAGWEPIGAAAWDVFRKHGKRFRFPDQDALNIIGNSRRIPMSLAWNFPIFMLNSWVEAAISPRIYHFMSEPKPWNGVFPPWGLEANTPYHDIACRHPDLEPYRSVFRFPTRFRYQLQQRGKQVLETFLWGLGPNRARILNYERGLTSDLVPVHMGRSEG